MITCMSYVRGYSNIRVKWPVPPSLFLPTLVPDDGAEYENKGRHSEIINIQPIGKAW